MIAHDIQTAMQMCKTIAQDLWTHRDACSTQYHFPRKAYDVSYKADEDATLLSDANTRANIIINKAGDCELNLYYYRCKGRQGVNTIIQQVLAFMGTPHTLMKDLQTMGVIKGRKDGRRVEQWIKFHIDNPSPLPAPQTFDELLGEL